MKYNTINQTVRTIIVDDEIFARKRISTLLNKIDTIEIIAESNNGTSAINDINSMEPDLIFLDINIRDMDGFQVVENISCKKKPFIIFITAHEDFALKAFDFEAFDYLVKPFKEDRFFKTVERVITQINTTRTDNFTTNLQKLLGEFSTNPGSYLKKFAIKQGNKTVLVPTEDINYIKGSGVYVEIYTNAGKYLHRATLNNLETQLDPNCFYRVHRSAFVNLNSVKEIVHSDYSEIDARMTDNKLISISKNLKKDFLKKLGI